MHPATVLQSAYVTSTAVATLHGMTNVGHISKYISAFLTERNQIAGRFPNKSISVKNLRFVKYFSTNFTVFSVYKIFPMFVVCRQKSYAIYIKEQRRQQTEAFCKRHTIGAKQVYKEQLLQKTDADVAQQSSFTKLSHPSSPCPLTSHVSNFAVAHRRQHLPVKLQITSFPENCKVNLLVALNGSKTYGNYCAKRVKSTKKARNRRKNDNSTQKILCKETRCHDDSVYQSVTSKCIKFLRHYHITLYLNMQQLLVCRILN